MNDKEYDYKDLVFKLALIVGGIVVLHALKILTFTITSGA